MVLEVSGLGLDLDLGLCVGDKCWGFELVFVLVLWKKGGEGKGGKGWKDAWNLWKLNSRNEVIYVDIYLLRGGWDDG